jgi:hypothetical protein
MPPRFYIETYATKPTRRILGMEFPVNAPVQFGWRAKAKGNHEILASGEAYTRRDSMMETVHILFGDDVEVRERDTAR